MSEQSKEVESYEEKKGKLAVGCCQKGFDECCETINKMEQLALSEGKRQGSEEGKIEGVLEAGQLIEKLRDDYVEIGRKRGYTEAIEKVKEIIKKEIEYKKNCSFNGNLDILLAIDKIKEPKGEGKQ
jgi:hypothetical protein